MIRVEILNIEKLFEQLHNHHLGLVNKMGQELTHQDQDTLISLI